MPRLGDILIDLDLCTSEQIHDGLAAQVLYGGRLGTNLVELGYLDLDALARGLARRARIPGAMGGHFERRDLAVQAKVPAELAAKLRAVPIGRLAHDSDRIAVAVRDRLTEHARGELAYHLDIETDRLVEAITPELRLYYHLELAYQIPRANRFLRVDRRAPIDLPHPPASTEDTDVDAPPWLPDAALLTPTSSPSLPVPEPAALDYQTAPEVDDETGKARRRFVPQLGESATLGRIAVRQVTTDVNLRPVLERDRPPPPRTLADQARAIRRAGSRDKVATMVVTALGELPASPFDAAVMLVARPPVAIGWKGFCHDGQSALEALAVPLGESCLMASAYQRRHCAITAVDGHATTRIDQQMWTLLGGRSPTWVALAPILVADQVVCLLYAHARVPLEAHLPLISTLAEAAGIGFGRLLRAAQR